MKKTKNMQKCRKALVKRINERKFEANVKRKKIQRRKRLESLRQRLASSQVDKK